MNQMVNEVLACDVADYVRGLVDGGATVTSIVPLHPRVSAAHARYPGQREHAPSSYLVVFTPVRT